MYNEVANALDTTMGILEEYIHSKRDHDLRSCIMETALYIEENTTIIFTDDELTPELLGTAELIKRTIMNKLLTP